MESNISSILSWKPKRTQSGGLFQITIPNHIGYPKGLEISCCARIAIFMMEMNEGLWKTRVSTRGQCVTPERPVYLCKISSGHNMGEEIVIASMTIFLIPFWSIGWRLCRGEAPQVCSPQACYLCTALERGGHGRCPWLGRFMVGCLPWSCSLKLRWCLACCRFSEHSVMAANADEYKWL